MKRKCGIVIAVISSLFFAGCGHVAPYMEIMQDRGLSKDYLEALNEWTRKETVYSQFETQLQISATYKGEVFRNAYLKEYARIYNLTDAEGERRKEIEADTVRDFTEIFLYAYTPRKDANDFEKANSVWTVFLIDDRGKRTEAAEIRRIEKVTPLMEEFYPYINKYYGNCYIIRFPAAAGTKSNLDRSISMVITGVLGRVELKWP